ncbi:hypothetical protein XENOCAPTIV_018092, partial [Xenoophorus captivus]
LYPSVLLTTYSTIPTSISIFLTVFAVILKVLHLFVEKYASNSRLTGWRKPD